MPAVANPGYAEVATEIGLTRLRALYPALTGAGVRVAQVEGSASNSATPGANDFEVDPGRIGHPAGNGFLSYVNGTASTAVFNDGSIGSYSAHATEQASFFYGVTTGVAPAVAHVDNYYARWFTETLLTPALPDKVVNLSFVYAPASNADARYDAAANADNIVFVAAAGFSGKPGSPSSAYNVISVDSSIATQAIGPAADGAAKPDISAPQQQTSRTAAIVSGCAALLVQAATQGWPGATPKMRADAADFRTVKALLLNGAVKPADYFSNAYAPTPSHPLSAIYGSGTVNILNSVRELYAGEVTPGPIASSATEGWTLGGLAASTGHDAVNAYALHLAAGQGLIATLTWAADNANRIDPLELDLIDKTTGTMLASSAATSSNVQQIEFKATAATDTVMQVRLHGSASVGRTDTYALAFAPLATVAPAP